MKDGEHPDLTLIPSIDKTDIDLFACWQISLKNSFTYLKYI